MSWWQESARGPTASTATVVIVVFLIIFFAISGARTNGKCRRACEANGAEFSRTYSERFGGTYCRCVLNGEDVPFQSLGADRVWEAY